MMRKLVLGLGATLLLVIAGYAAQTPKTMTYRGEIMDSACAKLGSHTAMMKKEGIATAKECTLGCVKNGAKFVLYNAATKKTYMLDDQTKPADFAGAKVAVTGTLDKATNTIHVTAIKAAA